MVQKKSAAEVEEVLPSSTSSRMTLEGVLPSGRPVMMQELTGADEISSAQEAEQNQALLLMCQVMRSIVELDGNHWDPATRTAQGTRNQFSSKDWRCIMEMHGELNLPTVEEASTFREGWKRSSISAKSSTH